MDPDKSRRQKIKAIIAVVATIIVIVFLAVALSGRQGTDSGHEIPIDSIPEADFDYTTQANIDGGEKLLEPLAHIETIEALSRDLHTFGRAAYDAYKNDTEKPVGFRITSDIDKRDGVVTFSGHYGSSTNKVTVIARLLNNMRMDLSIVDTVTNFNIDDALPSNSKANHFIGSLPISGDDYNITYAAGETINIGLYFRDPGIRDRAYQTIVDRIGEEEVIKLDITTTFPSEGFGL